MTHAPRHPVLLLVSAPSGAGKTTLCERLLAEFPDLRYSVSCTTRRPREGERDGEDYRFISSEEFDARAARGGFLEHAVVHGNRYGTPRREVEEALAAGLDVLMDIDVQGAEQIRGRLAEAGERDPLRAALADVFIAPPSMEVLRRRLEDRATDAPETIERRMRQAAAEMERWREYRYLVVNDVLGEAYDALRAILVAERHRAR
jgi:guanylate kinase